MTVTAEAIRPRPELKVDTQYGALLEGRWVPAPRFVLRRDRVLAAISDLAPGKVLEIGCGSGALLRELAQRGHECWGAETSGEARHLAAEMLRAFPAARIVESIDKETQPDVDLLIACEVLEHIDDHAAALAQWVRHLRPGGRLILSVPAHMRLWGVRDVWAGHFRRYSRSDLLGLAEANGLIVERIECYGFPLTSFTNAVANKSVEDREGLAGGAAAQAQATAASGVDRSVEVKLFGLQTSLPGRIAMKAGCILQRAFLTTDLGDGYLLVASRTVT